MKQSLQQSAGQRVDNANKNIFRDVDQAITFYRDTPIEIMENLSWSQYKVIKMCEFYSNSRYLKGNKDQLGREKPFYNIVNFRVTVAKVATMLDVKDIQIQSDEPKDWVRSMFLNHEAFEWMKQVNFANTLKEMTHTRAKYGGVLVKKYKNKKDGLKIEICDWKNMVTDQVNILSGLIIENHFWTPVELAAKRGVWDNVDEALELATQQKMTRKRGYNQEQFNTVKIPIQEVWGQLPKAYLKEALNEDYTDEEMYDYSMQHYFISTLYNQKFIFFAEENNDFPYKYLEWEKLAGRALGRGIMEDAEEAQIWTNDSVINEKHAMDLAGKVVIKTTSKKLGNNILTVDHGKIFEIEQGATLESLALEPAALGEFDAQVNKWKAQADYATSSFDANVGANAPADTPYSQTALMNQIASKPFDDRREEMGQFISEIFDDWVLPYLINKLYKGHILASDYTDDELKIIDQSFAVAGANKAIVKKILGIKFQDLLKGTASIPTPAEYASAVQTGQKKLTGKTRHIKFPDGYFDDYEGKVSVITSNETKNKQAVMQSLSTILQTVSQSYNQQTGKFMILENPILAKIFGTIVEMAGTGLSPTQLGISGNMVAPQTSPVAATPTQPQNAQPTAPPVQTPSPALQ